MKRIVLVLSHFGQGGTLEVMRSLAQGLRERGYPTELVAIYRGRYADSDEQSALLDVPQPGAFGYLAGVAKLRSRLKRSRPDVIISALPIGNLFSAIASLRCKPARVIATQHFPFGSQGRLLSTLEHVCGLTGLYTKVVCVSDTVADSLTARAAKLRENAIVIPNAAPPTTNRIPRAQVRAALGVDTNEFLFCAIGRLSREKNLAAGLEAFARTNHARLLLIGDGPQSVALRQLAEQKALGDRVIFTGALPHQDAIDHLMASDAFVQFSHYEGRSLSLLEAFAAGLPTVLSDIPSHRSTAGDAGVFFDPDDIESITGALVRVASDQELRESLSGASRNVASSSNVDAMVDRYVDLIERGWQSRAPGQRSPAP